MRRPLRRKDQKDVWILTFHTRVDIFRAKPKDYSVPVVSNSLPRNKYFQVEINGDKILSSLQTQNAGNILISVELKT